MQPRTQPHRNPQQPTSHEPHAGDETDLDRHDPAPQPDWPAQRHSTREEPTMTTHAATAIDWAHLHALLSTPFAESEIRYRAGATNRDKTKAQALPYVDPRAYEDRLNYLVPGSWEVTFEPWGEHRIICRLTIHGVTRSSTGEATDSPDGIAGTSAEAQAFKRACAKFGLGRHLYALTPQWVEYDAARKTVVPPVPRATAPIADHRPTEAPGIGRQRADDMAAALERAGVAREHQRGFAARAASRYVRDLAELNEHEARAVWLAAQDGRRTLAVPSAPLTTAGRRWHGHRT